MLASAYSTSDSQSNSPNLFVTTTTTTANGDSPLFSIDCTLIGSPSNTNATSNPNPMHEHDLEGSEHDCKEGAAEDEEEDRVVLIITVAQWHRRLGGDQEAPRCCVCFFTSRPALVLERGRWKNGRVWIGVPARRNFRIRKKGWARPYADPQTQINPLFLHQNT